MSEFQTVSESELQSVEGGLLPLGVVCFLAFEAGLATVISAGLIYQLAT